MTLHRITLTMGSPSATAWRADTFFGHLCWGMAYLEGESALGDFLGASGEPNPQPLPWEGRGAEQEGISPPLVLSDGFPDELLPVPVLLPSRAAAGQTVAQDRVAFQEAKKLKQRRWLTLEEFNGVLNGRPAEPDPSPGMPPWLAAAERVTFRNTIRRDTGTTGGEGEGGLHAHGSFFWKTVTFYARLGTGMSEERLERLLGYLEASGYGKEKSRGLGRVLSAKLEPFGGFTTPAQANGFVALSTFVPAASDPTDGAWKVLVKYGKVSEGFSVNEHPFKQPLTMLEAGAVFRTGGPPREWYGRMVHDIYPDDSRVKQYGLALALPIALG